MLEINMRSFRTVLLGIFLTLTAPQLCFAANLFLKAGGTGTGTSNWTNAAPCLKNLTIARGDVIYIARGNYQSCEALVWDFNVANSGTKTVELRAATAADHGSDTGWTTATMETTGSNQAILHPIRTKKDYFILNGVDRTGYKTGYRLKIFNTDGIGGAQFGPGALLIGDPFGSGGGTPSSNITVKFVQIEGSGFFDPLLCTWTDRGIQVVAGSGPNTDNKIQSSYVHDVGGESLAVSGAQNMIVEYTAFVRNHSAPACHGEGAAVREGTDNFTFRYNIMEDMTGTAYFSTPSGASAWTASNWYFYGNVFYRPTSSLRGSVGNGAINFARPGVWSGDVFIYNNTFAGINQLSCRINVDQAAPTAIINHMEVRNNLWVDCPTDNDGAKPGSVTTWTWSHNAYFNSGTTDVTATAQFLGADPLTAWTSANFHLANPTSAGFMLTSPFDTDPPGRPRGADGVWDRGAFEFVRPNPPQNLRTP